MGLDLVVVAVDRQHGAADAAVHRLGDVEGGHDAAGLDGLHDHRAGGLVGPGDAVLDLLGRMRLGEDARDEVLGEVGIVGEPVGAVVLVPALEGLARRQEVFRRHVAVARPDNSRHARQDRGLGALGMIGRDAAGEQAAERQADQDGLARLRRIHDRERVGHAIVQRIGRRVVRPVALAVAQRVVGDAAEAFAEIRDLRLVDARMDDAPGRQEHHGLRALTVDLVMDAVAVALGEPFGLRQLGAHGSPIG